MILGKKFVNDVMYPGFSRTLELKARYFDANVHDYLRVLQAVRDIAENIEERTAKELRK